MASSNILSPKSILLVPSFPRMKSGKKSNISVCRTLISLLCFMVFNHTKVLWISIKERTKNSPGLFFIHVRTCIRCFRVMRINYLKIGFLIVIRIGKIAWKRGPYCWYFCLNLHYLAWPHRAYIKTAKNGEFCKELLSKNDFEAVLVTLLLWSWCQDLWESSKDCCRSEGVSQMLLACYNLLNSQNIANLSISEKWLVTRIPPT